MIIYVIATWYEHKTRTDRKGRLRARPQLEWFHGQTRFTPDGRRITGRSFLNEHAARMAFRKQLKEEYPAEELKEL